MTRYSIFFLLIVGFASQAKLLTFNGDSLRKAVKPPKHYFSNTIYADAYATGQRDLPHHNYAGKKLGSYQVNQVVLGFSVPVATKDFYNKDSTRISNLHLLLTGSYAGLTPQFTGIPNHHFTKASIGFRGIFNDGRKSIFFAELSPFLTRDRGYAYTGTGRIAGTLLWNIALSDYFGIRFGYTRSFLWGNRYHLPYIGIRVGRLDGVNFSVQFPRIISFTVPAGKYVRTSLYTKPQGGLYSMANVDGLYTLYNDKTIYFGRYEFLSGLWLDVLPSRYFNFYVSGGLTTQNYLAFFSKYENKQNQGMYSNFYKARIDGSIFVNFGLTLRFGRTKSIYNNQQMYNAMDLNNSIDGGDNNVQTGNGNIPTPVKQVKVKPSDVQDLVDTQDLY